MHLITELSVTYSEVIHPSTSAESLWNINQRVVNILRRHYLDFTIFTKQIY